MQVYCQRTGYVRIYKYAMKGGKDNLNTFFPSKENGNSKQQGYIKHHLNKSI